MSDGSAPSTQRRRQRSSGGARSHRSSNDWAQEKPSPLLVRLTDAGLYLTLFVIPWIFAGRISWGHVALIFLSSLTAICWCLHQFRSPNPRYVFCGAELIFAGVLLLIGLQLTPLPQATIDWLSPDISKSLALQASNEAGMFAPWTTLSLTPEETRRDLLIIAACMLFFLTAVQRIETFRDIRRLMLVNSLTAAAVALFGLVQFFTSNGKFFWFFDHYRFATDESVRGPFTNPNQFSNYLAMAIPVTIALMLYRFHDRREGAPGDTKSDVWLWIHALTLALIGPAILLSFSRGGMAIGAAAVALMLLGCWFRGLVASRTLGMILLAGVLCSSGLLLFGQRLEKMISDNFSRLATTDVDTLDNRGARRILWSAAWELASTYPVAGAGLGGHRDGYQRYYDSPTDIDFTHAENGYLQVAEEAGALGVGLLALLILLFGVWGLLALRRRRRYEEQAAVIAIGIIFAITLAHSLTDFMWYAPACVNIVLIGAAMMFHLARREPFAEKSEHVEARSGGGFRRAVWLGFAPATAVFAALALQIKVPEAIAEMHFFEYLRHGRQLLTAVAEEDRAQTQELRFRTILRAVKADPTRYRYLLAAGKQYLLMFHARQLTGDNPLNLPELRQAVAELSFSTREQADGWLNKPGVIGKTRKYLTAARSCLVRAIQLCPLQAESYVLLKDVVWLDWPPQELEGKLMDQALVLRPHDSCVNLAWGAVLMQRQEYAEGTKYWVRCYQQSTEYHEALISVCSKGLPASYLLDNFPLDYASLLMMKKAYQDSPDREGHQNVLRKIASTCEDRAKGRAGNSAAYNWYTAFQCYLELGDLSEATRCAQMTTKTDPFHLPYRKAIGIWYYRTGAFSLAARELKWCLKLDPGDQQIAKIAEEAVRQAENRLAPAGQIQRTSGLSPTTR
jgi:O-antigen ligase/tetratricopeptide (TPR) repeat protein